MALLAVGSTSAEAQQQPSVSNVFQTSEACIANLGKVPYYDPQFLGNVGKNPVNGTTRIAAPIEGDACVRMVTMRGWAYAPLKSGTVLRWTVDAAGNRTPYAHDKCGNDLDRLVYPPEASAPVISATPEPQTVVHRDENGDVVVNVTNINILDSGKKEVEREIANLTAKPKFVEDRRGFPTKTVVAVAAAAIVASLAITHDWSPDQPKAEAPKTPPNVEAIPPSAGGTPPHTPAPPIPAPTAPPGPPKVGLKFAFSF